MKKLLEITPPKGKEFLRAVEHILEREKNWVCVLLSLLLSGLKARVGNVFYNAYNNRSGGNVMDAHHLKSNR